MTTRDDIEARKKDMQPWYWWGIPTFFKCPWNEDPEACDIALIGVPHSAGTDRPSVISTSARGRCLRIVKAHQRTPGVSGRDRDGGFPRRIDVVPPVLRCEGIAASGPRLAKTTGSRLYESLSLQVGISIRGGLSDLLIYIIVRKI